MTYQITIDDKISSLKRGESMILSIYNGITISVERASNSNKLRFVRTFVNGSFKVFQTSNN